MRVDSFTPDAGIPVRADRAAGRRFSIAALIGAALAACAGCAAAGCKLDIVAEFPVTIVAHQPLVVVRINGTAAPVVLDSGATFNLLTYGAAARLNLAWHALTDHPSLSGAGGVGSSLLALTVADVALGVARVYGAQFVVASSMPAPGVGFIGGAILENYDIDYDLPKRMIKLVRPSGCAAAPLAYWAHSRVFSVADYAVDHSSVPTIVGRVNGATVRIVVDTGASVSVLSLRAAARAGLGPDSPGAIPGGTIRGASGATVRTWIVPVSSVTIAGESIRNTRLRIGHLRLPSADMVLGTDFFLSHRVYFANSQRKLYFTYQGGPVFVAKPP